MADSNIVGLPVGGTLTDVEKTAVVQTGINYGITTFKIRNEGGNIIANSPGPSIVEIGAVGPSGEPGTKWTPGTTVSYLDAQGGITVAAGATALLRLYGDVNRNLSVGNQTFLTGSTGSDNTLFGSGAGTAINGSTSNTAIGYFALRGNPAGNNNTAVGWLALQANTGSNNTGVGANALRDLTTGSGNTAVGSGAMIVETTGSNNTAIGNAALFSQVGASNNTAVGFEAGLSLVTGSNNTAVGWHALRNAAGASNRNVAVGYKSQELGTAGDDNVSVGHESLINNTSSGNVAIGHRAMYTAGAAMSGTGLNTAVGVNALRSNDTGHSNVAVGYQAMYTAVPANANTTGARNVAVGWNAGANSATQFNNSIAVGANAKYNADFATAIGANTLAGGNGSVAFGTDNTGTGASTTVANEIKLGTSLHTVAFGRFMGVSTTAGTGNLARVGGVTHGHFADSANVAPGPTVLYSDVVVAYTWNSVGDKVYFKYSGTLAANANVKTLQVKIDGNVFGGGAAGFATASAAGASFDIEGYLIRSAATELRGQMWFTAAGAAAPSSALSYIQAGFDFTLAHGITLEATSAANNDVVATLGRLRFLPARV